MELLNVSFQKIFIDNPDAARFSFSYGLDVDAASDLLEKAGTVRNPPSLRRVGERYEVVCGFKRARAYVAHNLGKMPAIVYEHAELTDEQCLWLNLLEGEGAGTLSPVERAIVLQKFSEIGYNTDRLVMEIGQRVGLPHSYVYVNNLLRLVSLAPEVLRGVHTGEFGVEQAFLLIPLDSQEGLALFNLLKSCKANLNETRELIPLILDIAALKEIDPLLFISKQTMKLFSIEPDSPRRRLQILREFLRKERYPALNATETRFNEVIRNLALGKTCRIEAPRYFEGNDITVTIRASNYEQLHEVTQKLLNANSRKGIQALFGILKGEDAE